jgi:hypothetical protein
MPRSGPEPCQSHVVMDGTRLVDRDLNSLSQCPRARCECTFVADHWLAGFLCDCGSHRDRRWHAGGRFTGRAAAPPRRRRRDRPRQWSGMRRDDSDHWQPRAAAGARSLSDGLKSESARVGPRSRLSRRVCGETPTRPGTRIIESANRDGETSAQPEHIRNNSAE